MFEAAKRITASASSLENAVAQTVAVARHYCDIFDEPDFWQRVERHDFRLAFAIMTDWTREGLARLAEADREEVKPTEHLILDLGDCPEIFWLYLPSSPKMIGQYDEKAFGLVHASVFALPDHALIWASHEAGKFHGDNSYFLWLVLGCLAFVTPLESIAHRRIFLSGWETWELHAGFEGLYFPLATVNHSGVIYPPVQSLPEPPPVLADLQMCWN